MQIFNKLQDEYDQLWKYIIRPTRTPYPDAALGPETFSLQNTKIKRNSFQLINDRGKVFFGSHFVPLESSSYPCVIYLHGNSSNQTEGMEYMSELLKNNISLCTFDFSGCGNSEGEYVTLGYYQWKDVEEVVMHIKAKEKVTKIGIWGRSMGAVTALRYISRNPQIVVGIYDNPFKSLKSLIGDLCKKNSKIPMFILSGALKIIASTIKEKANFDIYDLDPLKNEAPTIKVPGFFVVSEQDQMVPPQHSKMLFEAYKSKKKQIRVVKGDHNAVRPEACIKDVIKFLKKYLFKGEKSEGRELEQSSGGKKLEQIDFFNDDFDQAANQFQLNTNMCQETKEVDFFVQDTTSTEKQFDKNQFQKYAEQANRDGEPGGTILFSLNQMFAGVFSSQKKPRLAVDGYDQLRSRIKGSISAGGSTGPNPNSSDLSSQPDKQAEKLGREFKSYDDSFEKQFASNPSLYVW